jgi:hypothetical protein
VDLIFNRPGSTVDFTDVFWKEPRTFTVLTGTPLTGSFTLGTVGTDAGGRAATPYGSFALRHTADSVALVFTPVLTPHEVWLQANFGADWSNPAIAGDNADPDGDGVANLLERAFGGNPDVSEAGILPVPDPAPAPLSILYRKAVAASDLILTIQESQTLLPASWQTATGTETTVSDNGTVQTIRFTAASGGPGRKFLRLHVSRP